MKYLVISAVVSSAFGKPKDVLSGKNEEGYTFIVREGGSLIFDLEPQSQCSEAFTFRNVVSAFAHSAATQAQVVPCRGPSRDELASLRSLIAAENITASTICTQDSVGRIKVSCSTNSVVVSRRLATVVPDALASFGARVGCEEDDHDKALLECAKSIQTFNALTALIHPSGKPLPPVAVEPVKPEPVVETVDVETNATEETEAVQEEIPAEAQDGEERKLGIVSGRNQAGYSFEVLDGGIASFLPRVGEECRESFILDGLSTPQRYNAMARTNIAPCQPLPSNIGLADIDPSWDILSATVNCNDPVHITISCKISINNGPAVEMSRTAILQAFKNNKFLSSRVSCDAPSDKEKLECAAIATNYLFIMAQVAN
jgi:hypothetical protein